MNVQLPTETATRSSTAPTRQAHGRVALARQATRELVTWGAQTSMSVPATMATVILVLLALTPQDPGSAVRVPWDLLALVFRGVSTLTNAFLIMVVAIPLQTARI